MIKNKIKAFASLALAAGLMVGCSSGNTDTKSSTEDSYNIATVRWADWGEDFTKGFVEETVKEAGIKVDWDIYVNSEWGDKKAILLSGGELPDAFFGSLALSDSDIAKNPGVFIPLEDMIDEHMPNLVKAFADDPALRAMVTSPDGHIYSLPKKLPLRPHSRKCIIY